MQTDSENLDKDAHRLLVILAKYPQPGIVKTRLAKSIGEEKATELYRACLADLTPRFVPHSGSIFFNVRWVYTPDTPEFERLIRKLYSDSDTDEVTFVSNATPGLAEHQINQLQWAHLNGYQQTVIITTDSRRMFHAH